MCFLESACQSHKEDERLTNARIVDQNVNFSTEEFCSILDFFSNAIYTLVMEQARD
jgi:hypothetical protein